MKKKIGLLLFALLISFSFINVEAKTVWKFFLVGCQESENAYFDYFGERLEHSGSYPIEVDENHEADSLTQGCAPSISNNMACSFGCLEEAVDNANNSYVIGNTTDLFDAFGNAGNSVNSYCKEVCFDKKEFIGPENNAITVKQGTRFNWLNSEGHILTLRDSRSCITFFDSNSWQNDYNSARNQIDSVSNSLRSNSYALYCRDGYEYENGSCVLYSIVGSIYDSYTLSCRNGYDYNGSGLCVMTTSYRNQLISQRNSAVNKINSLIADANSCYNHNSSPIAACDDVKISYADEVYGPVLDADGDAAKLEKTGGSRVVSDAKSATNRVFYRYTCGNDTNYCSRVAVNVPFLKSHTMEFYTEYNWDLQDDVFSCVDISGYSHLRCEYANKFNGTNNHFGKYQNYIKLGSNLPVNFNSLVGKHEIYIDYGCDDATNTVCNYNVSKCPDGVCEPTICDPNVEDCNGGIDVIYRVIDLNNPFPNRTPGYNWSVTGFVDKYITNNRNVKTDKVYSEEPMYTIELDPALIKEIRISNKDVNYGDMDLYCTDGVECRSSYLRELRDNGYLSGCGTLDNFDACEVGG